jgi:hypothetical protein
MRVLYITVAQIKLESIQLNKRRTHQNIKMNKLKTLWAAYRWYFFVGLILLLGLWLYFQFFGKASVEKGNKSLDKHYVALAGLSTYKQSVEEEYFILLVQQLAEQQSLYSDSAEWQMSEVMKRRWEMVQSKFTTNDQTNFFKKVIQRIQSDKTQKGLAEASLRIRNAQDYASKFALRMPVKTQLIKARSLSLIDLSKRIDSLEALVQVEAKTIIEITDSYKSTGKAGGEMANVRRAKELIDASLKLVSDPLLRYQYTLDTCKATGLAYSSSSQTALAEFDNADEMLKSDLNAIVPSWEPVKNTTAVLRNNAEILYRGIYRTKLYNNLYIPIWTKELNRLKSEQQFWQTLSDAVAKM